MNKLSLVGIQLYLKNIYQQKLVHIIGTIPRLTQTFQDHIFVQNSFYVFQLV
jgi:hypothetical protein